MWLTLLWSGTALLLFGMSASTIHHLRWVQRLPRLRAPSTASDGPQPESWPPFCSVVIAARDEAARIEGTVHLLLVQRELSLEVIVVDDRSTDGTGDIVARIARDDPRVRLLRVHELPEGWLGKCHACHVGAATATGDWILFADADCWLKPDVLARAFAVAQRDGADHVTLSPGVAAETTPARAWHLVFLLSLADWYSGVNRDRPGAHLGIGAFNLVRATAYHQCGGHEALRLTVVDDIKLGLLLSRSGFRTRAFIGGDDAECDWGVTVRQMIHIMEKNYFAILNFRSAVALGGGGGGLLLWLVAFAGPASGTPAGFAAGLALLSLIVPAAIVARRLGWPLSAAVVAPFIYPALFYAMLRSMWVTLRQGGIRWRDTFYSLEILRRGAVR